jgi:hypothetical protein
MQAFNAKVLVHPVSTTLCCFLSAVDVSYCSSVSALHELLCIYKATSHTIKLVYLNMHVTLQHAVYVYEY